MANEQMSSVSQLADAVSEAARRRAKDLELAHLAEGLETRLNELRAEGSSISALSRAASTLRSMGAPPWERRSRTLLTNVRKKIEKLKQDFGDDATAITKANAVCKDDLKKLGDLLGEQLASFWKAQVLRTAPTEGVLGVFEKHAKFRRIVSRLRELRNQLDVLASRLPQTEKDLRSLRSLQTDMKSEFAKLPELTDSVKRFLQNSIAPGVVLRDLLQDTELMEWIRKEKMDIELRVFSGQSGTSQG